MLPGTGTLMVSTLSRGQHANVQNSVVVGTGTLIRNGSGIVNTLDTGRPFYFWYECLECICMELYRLDSWNVNYAGYYVDTALS